MVSQRHFRKIHHLIGAVAGAFILAPSTWAGENTFSAGVGTMVHQAQPTTAFGQPVTIKVDTEDPAPSQAHGLIQFNNLFTNDGGPIPLGSDIHYAGMRLVTTNTSAQGATFHRMLQPWSTSSTWNSMGAGIQADGTEAVAGPVVDTGATSVLGPRSFNVSGSLQSWSGGAAARGWGVLPKGSDGWEFANFTNATTANRPQMKVVYSPQAPGAIDATFQQGVGGYTGTRDTRLRGAGPDDNTFATNTELSVDSDDAGLPTQSLLKFTKLFNNDGGSIPVGATIVSAWLDLNHVDQGHGADVHRMLSSWNDTDTWNTLGGGVQANGIEALAGAETHLDGTFYNPTGDATNLITGRVIFDVTASVQAWANGAANQGWAFLPFNTDGWRFSSAEGLAAPTLHIRYVPEPSSLILLAITSMLISRRRCL